MALTVLYMSISLDGFIAGPNENCDENPLGADGGYLHGWFPAGVTPGDATSRRSSEDINSQICDELSATGAIVAGAGPSSRPIAGAAIITTGCRSSSTVATSLASTSAAGRS
jgi:hypothetical protein